MHKKIEIKKFMCVIVKKMSLAVFNTKENLGNIEKFKLLPNELQDIIADYNEEVYNKKCFYYDWYKIIKTIGYRYSYDYLIDLLNKHMTNRKIGPLIITDCKNMPGYCHTCYKFIRCDEKLEVGFYYDYVKMHPGKRYFWEEDLIKAEKATQLIMDKIDEYINSNRYDYAVMYQINKTLLDIYNDLDIDDDSDSEDL